MIRTLHAYIGRDLVRVTALAVIAFTLVLTVFAIIEPLREQGLDGRQAISLFLYTLPVTLSLTLPVAALLSATIVYGRFSQDNELLACKASGVSALTVCKPALVLAVATTAASLVLSNFVAPAMAARADATAKANFRGIVYNQLRTRHYIEGASGAGKVLIHADEVVDDVFEGVVALHLNEKKRIVKDPVSGKDIEVWEDQSIVATTAASKVNFINRDGETYVDFDALEIGGGAVRNFDYGWARRQRFPAIRLPSLTKEKPAMKEWPDLIRTMRHPELDRKIAADFDTIRQGLAREFFCHDTVQTFEGGFGRVVRLPDEERSCYLMASRAVIPRGGKGNVVRLEGRVDELGRVSAPVCLTVIEDGQPLAALKSAAVAICPPGPASAVAAAQRPLNDLLAVLLAPECEMEARSASPLSDAVEGELGLFLDEAAVSIKLLPGVCQACPGGGDYRHKEWQTQVSLPEESLQKARSVRLDTGEEQIRKLVGENSTAAGKLRSLAAEAIPALRGKIAGEINGRVAYGIDCFLLVVVGAALGLIFRGGQIISAFTIAMIPGSVAIIMVFMGKWLAGNASVPLQAGLGVMWGGVAALAAATVGVYAYLGRK